MTVSEQQIRIETKPEAERGTLPADSAQLGFGSRFTDHMFCLDYRDGGWHDARIQPYGPITLDPAALVLHYGQEVFEGMKAYRGVDGVIRLFRPDKNAERMARSCERMCMAVVEPTFFVEAIRQLVEVEQAWVPKDPGTALYIRPTMIATEAILGVRAAKEYLFYVICSPVGPYFPQGFKPIDLLVSKTYVRAVEGGVGNAKTGGNYAASLLAGKEAAAAGFSQVLYLDAKEHRYVEEVGAMNMMFAFGETIVTPPLTGSILPGVTRMSVIELARGLGYKVEERPLDIAEVQAGARDGSLTEVFGTGTAAAIAPVGRLRHEGEDLLINDQQVGPVAEALYNALQDIQYGRADDSHGWTVTI